MDLNTITPETLAAFQPEYYFHLAATFERSTETPDFLEENFTHNVRLSHHLMQCLKSVSSLKHVIFASSYLIYDPDRYLFSTPQSEAVRLDESTPISPRNLCGVAKLLHERELEFLSRHGENKFRAVSARIFRSYGKNSRDIISRWIRMALNGEPITVYSPEGRFDYIYAGDVAEGLLHLGCSTAAEGIVNLGRDHARSVAEVLDVLKRHFPNLSVQTRSSDIPFEASRADMSLFKARTGWTPEQDPEDIIPMLIAYEQTKLNS